MNKILLAVFLCASFAAVSQGVAANRPKKSLAERRAEIEARVGGYLQRSGTGVGKAVIVNAQSVVAASNVTRVASKLDDKLKMRFEVRDVQSASLDGDWLSFKKKVEAGALVVLIADEKTPSLLLAPDEQWAVININRLAAGLKTESAKSKFMPGRVRRQIIRAFADLAGNGRAGDRSPATINDLMELDSAFESLPLETFNRVANYLEGQGLTKREYASYGDACQEGWAPAPTNEIQKVIWNQINELPTKPIKVEFDPKKGE